MIIINPSFIIEDEIDGEKILKSIEKAGRTCYKSESQITFESAKSFVKRIIEMGHYSVLEHEKVTVRVICDRGVTHEIVRHRIASYSQESSRYCNYANDKFDNQITVIEPCFWKAISEEHEIPNYKTINRLIIDEKKYEIWHTNMRLCEDAYIKLIELGATPQEARSVLPNSLKTEIVITMNLREWLHFFTLRVSNKAHPQMREIAIMILKEFKQLIPIIFDNINYENNIL